VTWRLVVALAAVALAGCGADSDDDSDAADATTTAAEECDHEIAWVHAVSTRTVFMCRRVDLPEPPADATSFWMVGEQPGQGKNTMSGEFGIGAHDHVWQPKDGAPCALFLLVPGTTGQNKRETVSSGEVELISRVDVGNGLVDIRDAATVVKAIEAGVATPVYTGVSFAFCFGRTNPTR
jgi:hypothetical protein